MRGELVGQAQTIINNAVVIEAITDEAGVAATVTAARLAHTVAQITAEVDTITAGMVAMRTKIHHARDTFDTHATWTDQTQRGIAQQARTQGLQALADEQAAVDAANIAGLGAQVQSAAIAEGSPALNLP